MPKVPDALLHVLQNAAGFDRAAFEAVHQSGEQVTSIRVNPAKPLPDQTSLPIESPVPWTRFGYYLSQRPSFTFDPLFHAGCYYVQEASSMFLEQALMQHALLDQPLRVLDLCAAPGGKSTHIQSLLSKESLLVSNEVIRGRASILQQNITRWGAANVVVTSNDPQHFARLRGYFDVIVADAPCSGSGLFRRDPDAISEWSPDAVQLCCGRQQRILNDVLPALKAGGLLIYSTCSYSPEENEAVLDKLVQDLPLQSLTLNIPVDWHIVTGTGTTGARGYRFYPDKIRGEGFFIACLRKTDGETQRYKKGKVPEQVSAKEKKVLDNWIQTGGLQFYKHDNHIYALPESMEDDLVLLQTHLYLQQAGLRTGTLIRERLVPDHALAMSTVLRDSVPTCPVEYDQAIKYLQRADITLHAPVAGWQTVSFKGHNLGWINALPNRINNYYPKELRILKEEPGTRFQ